MYLQIIYTTADVTSSLNSSRFHFCALRFLWPDKSVFSLWFAADPSKSHGTLCDGEWPTIALAPPVAWTQQDEWPYVCGQAAYTFLQGRTSIIHTERDREQPPSFSPSFERLASAVGGMWAIMVTSSDKTKYRCRRCMIMLSVHQEVPLVQSSNHFIGGIIWSLCEMRQEHVVWWEAGQQTLLRTVTEHTAVKSFCQSDLRHGAINQRILERTWKQQSHDGWVNAASSHSSHWVWVRGKRGGWRSGLPAATGSSSRDLHISDRPTGGKCKIQLLAFFFLVQISHLFFCACVFFF